MLCFRQSVFGSIFRKAIFLFGLTAFAVLTSSVQAETAHSKRSHVSKIQDHAIIRFTWVICNLSPQSNLNSITMPM